MTFGMMRFWYFDIWKLEFWKSEMFENFEKCNSGSRDWVFVIFTLNYGLICCFSNRGDEVSMCQFKEIDFGLRNNIFNLGGHRTSFSGETPFRYAQSGYERTSFSGSTVCVGDVLVILGQCLYHVLVMFRLCLDNL